MAPLSSILPQAKQFACSHLHEQKSLTLMRELILYSWSYHNACSNYLVAKRLIRVLRTRRARGGFILLRTLRSRGNADNRTSHLAPLGPSSRTPPLQYSFFFSPPIIFLNMEKEGFLSDALLLNRRSGEVLQPSSVVTYSRALRAFEFVNHQIGHLSC